MEIYRREYVCVPICEMDRFKKNVMTSHFHHNFMFD